MASQYSDGNVRLAASCLCKDYQFTTTVPSSTLPLQAWACHCTSCRHITGALYTHDALWPGPTSDVTSSDLSVYQFTKNVALLFCGKCSTPMFWWERFNGQEEVLDMLIGALEVENGEGREVVRTVRNAYVGDTVDGGAAPWLRSLAEGQDDIPTWTGKANASELLDPDWHTTPVLGDAEDPDEIPIVCHCRGVNLVLRRGDADFAKMKREDLPFFVDPSDHKLLASFDACGSCRKSFGINVMNWTFTLLKHIAFPDGTPFPITTHQLKDDSSAKSRDERLGTLAFYKSSPDVQRYFCSRCSASVFYAVDDRPDMVDLAVGLLDSPDGARAESRLAWALGPPVTWKKEAKGHWTEGFVAKLEENTEAWRIRTGRDKIWLRADRERAAGS